MSKQCTKCKNIKPLTEYNKQTKSKDGLTYWCKCCISAAMKTRTRAKFKYNQEYYLKRNYNITQEQYNEILSSQGGVCKICKRTDISKALHVDHCHKTNKIRGLLCNTCNRGLGFFKDNLELLKEAINYVSSSSS